MVPTAGSPLECIIHVSLGSLGLGGWVGGSQLKACLSDER